MPQRQRRAVPQKPCSAPPKRRPAAYDHRPGAALGQAGRTRRASGEHPSRVRVILPAGPPALTPEAARALLRILIDAQERARTDNTERKERP
jgi:hypothetical protein